MTKTNFPLEDTVTVYAGSGDLLSELFKTTERETERKENVH